MDMNRYLTKLSTILTLIYASYGYSETHISVSPNTIGKTVTMDSAVLNEKRTINVYFPPSYDASQKDYTVLYVNECFLFFTPLF